MGGWGGGGGGLGAGGGGGGAEWPVFHISILVMNRLNATESDTFIYLVYSQRN